ncbi:hypothetical protein ACFO0N_09510 [Halobium salinum]|uniref:Polyprenyl synthetase n=1 Tax=Halobium salinum TaxID=1364940 RepID=A0ABD5PBW5_9EURY|nr:hypothetical protein [Halobium salinum]
MDDAVRTRDAAREALADVEPPALGGTLDDRLADAPMTPGALALLCARSLNPGVDPDAVAERAAGVQLIYEGLRLTRYLAHEEPWTTEPESDIDADLDIVAADVLVARGFYLLARTGAAEQAVETVRRFGRDQTLRRAEGADPVALDRNLEADVFELAVVAGVDVGGDTPSAALREYAAGLARGFDPVDGEALPPAAAALPETVADRIVALSANSDVESAGDRVPSSATDP